MSELIMGNFPELIPEDLIKRAESLGPALLCDGMKGWEIEREGCMDSGIKPVSRSMRIAATALTVSTSDGDNFPIHIATYSAKPGFVMVIDGGGCDDRAYFGDLIVGAAQAVGLSGMIVDGYSRDVNGITELGFPVFSRGYLPRGPVKKNPGKINTAIRCGGLSVNPGDLIVADADGIAVVPRARIEEALILAEEKKAYEIKRRTVIEEYSLCKREGRKEPQLAPQWVVDLLASTGSK